MQIRNSSSQFGVVSIMAHWLVAIAVFGLFGLGYYMVGLSYYDEWYRLGPDVHRSIGILLFIAVVLRVVWRLMNPMPRPLPSHQRWEVWRRTWPTGCCMCCCLSRWSAAI